MSRPENVTEKIERHADTLGSPHPFDVADAVADDILNEADPELRRQYVWSLLIQPSSAYLRSRDKIKARREENGYHP